jgi:ankyrin repeat protein
LETLPSDLGKAFAKTLTRIEQQLDSLFEKAKKIIVWIHLAERPLTVGELLCSLAIRDSDTFLDPSGIPIRKTLLNCCHGPAVIDQEMSTVRLVHYSLQEHLHRQDQIFGLTKAQWHSRIAHTCLTFLKFSTTEWVPPQNISAINLWAFGERKWDHALQKEEQSPDAPVKLAEEIHFCARQGYHHPLQGLKITLLWYAATQWAHHLRKGEQSPDAPMKLAQEYLRACFRKELTSFRLLYPTIYGRDGLLPDNLLPAHIVAFFGVPALMSYLISTAAEPDSKDYLHRTPLSWAATRGHETVVKLLLESGLVDVNSLDIHSQTPLSLAATEGHQAVVKLLLENSQVDLNSKDVEGRTALSWAAGNGYETVVNLLLESERVNINSKDYYGLTPFLWAVMEGHQAVVKLLLRTGQVAIDSRDGRGRTPLSWAARAGNKEVVKLLLETGQVDVNSMDYEGHTPVSLAAKKGHMEVVSLLSQSTNRQI